MRSSPGAGDQHEEGLLRAQQLLHLQGAVAEPLVERAEGLEELGHVAQQVHAHHLVEEALGAPAEQRPTWRRPAGAPPRRTRA